MLSFVNVKCFLSCRFSPLSSFLFQGCVSEDLRYADEVEEDTLDEWDSPAPPTPTKPNGEIWPPVAPSSPPRRSHSTVTNPGALRAQPKAKIVPELSLVGSKFSHLIPSKYQNILILLFSDPLVSTPQGTQRTLAEIEYDWLAEVVERIFLVLFMVLFVICSFGINAFGFYFWWHIKEVDKVNDEHDLTGN